MSNKKSQKQWAIDRLLNEGYVSRNGALQVFCTRLGAIVCSLCQKEGWEISGGYEKTEHGKDFVYRLINSPFKKQIYKIAGTNREIIRYEK